MLWFLFPIIFKMSSNSVDIIYGERRRHDGICLWITPATRNICMENRAHHHKYNKIKCLSCFSFHFHSDAFVALSIVRVRQNVTSSIWWYMCDTVRVWSLSNQKWDQGQKLLQNNNTIWMNEWKRRLRFQQHQQQWKTRTNPLNAIRQTNMDKQILFLLSFWSCFRSMMSIESMNKIETIVPTVGSDPVNVWPRNREKASIFI